MLYGNSYEYYENNFVLVTGEHWLKIYHGNGTIITCAI